MPECGTCFGQLRARIPLTDRTSISRAPDTLVLYTQPDVQHFTVELGARQVGSEIVIDLSAGFGPRPHDYVTAQRLLAAGLAREFGTRATLVEHPDILSHHATQ